MANGNPADVGYSANGVPSSILEGLMRQINPKAAGLSAFTQGLMPGLSQGVDDIPKIQENQRINALVKAMSDQQTQQQQTPQQPFPQGSPMPNGPMQSQGQGQVNPYQAPNPMANMMQQRLGMGAPGMGAQGLGSGNQQDPLGIFS